MNCGSPGWSGGRRKAARRRSPMRLRRNETKGVDMRWRAVVGMCVAVLGIAGCGTLDRAYDTEVTWEDIPVVRASGGPVPGLETNIVSAPTTNLVARPEALATIEAAGNMVNTFLPGIGSIVALALGGLYHGYRQVRNRKVNAALVQGVETARAILETTPQGQHADAAFVKWLMRDQKRAGIFTTVTDLVDTVADNPAAKLAAEEIAKRVQMAARNN